MTRLALVLVLAAACNDKAAAPAADPEVKTKAELTVKKLAFEAYPMWASKHPELACPKQLADILGEVELEDSKDPWGHDMKMGCGPDLPRGARGFAVSSAGPDGKFDTADDVRSW